MANPSTKNGYFMIPNELAEQFAKADFTGTEWRILWVVMRQTWGWQAKKGDKKKKEWDWIALSQFSEKTGIKRSNVAKVLKPLVCDRILDKEVGPKKRYRLNTDYDQWVVSHKRLGIPRHNTKGMLQHTNLVSPSMPTKENKETITKDIPAPQGESEIPKATIVPAEVVEWSQWDALKKIAHSPNRVHFIAGLILVRKENIYENKDQFNAAFKRALRPAKELVGYTNQQIKDAIEAAKLQGEELGFDWQPQTVVKNIERVTNPK